MKTRFYVIIGTLWLVLGLLFGAPFMLPRIMSTQQSQDQVKAAVVDNSVPVTNEEPLISGEPSHITFPSVDVSVDVAPGHYDPESQTWTLSKDKAMYATAMSLPNNKTGNTFIYGHNRWQVFTKLMNAKQGDKAIVTTSNGHTFTYTLVSIVDVKPEDTSHLRDHKSPILTVQTCSGIWYENRRMFTFELTEVK